MAPPPASIRPLRLAGLAMAALFLSASLCACGGGGASTPRPFAVLPPSGGPGTGAPPAPLPPPTTPRPPVFVDDAIQHHRAPLFGAFPSDLVRLGTTLFTVDADQIEGSGALIVPYDISGDAPVPSATSVPVRIDTSHLVDALGRPADLLQPIGFGFYLNEMEVITTRMGFVVVNAGGSDSTPPLSNLLLFDPATGQVVQTVNLCRGYASPDTLYDSAGGTVPGNAFLQSGAEALAFVPTSPTTGRLYVGMTNLIVGYPSLGTVKYPGTIQVYDVDRNRGTPITVVADANGLSTRTLRTGRYNPVSLDVVADASGLVAPRVLITLGGATAYDASLNLVPSTPAAVEVLDGASGAPLGTFEMGLTGLVNRPAIGRDGAGHLVGFFPSGATGQVYVLQLDGLLTPLVTPAQLRVLRGPANGIVIDTASGSPGGNIVGMGLAPDGDVLAVTGFGDLFAGRPGRLLLLSLPTDLVRDATIGSDFVPGISEFATVTGRTMGGLVLRPNRADQPDVYVNLSGPVNVDGSAAGPASVGSLTTHGLID